MDPEVWIIYLECMRSLPVYFFNAHLPISTHSSTFLLIAIVGSKKSYQLSKAGTAFYLIGSFLILFPNHFEPKPALLSSATSSFLHRCSPKPFSLPLCLCPSVGLVKPSFWLFEEIRSVFLPSLPVWKINKILP
jgi:hypothetical protein